jgi:hypothetical protein
MSLVDMHLGAVTCLLIYGVHSCMQSQNTPKPAEWGLPSKVAVS